ncbi:hypothetical protein V1509DRAFT_649457 [Lipomyces kononenkoae]
MASNEYPISVMHVKDGRPRSGRVVLVDRVWPRGQRKDEAPWDEWLKTIAPSTELRKWYGHDRDKHDEFIRRYEAELEGEEQTKAFEHLAQPGSSPSRSAGQIITDPRLRYPEPVHKAGEVLILVGASTGRRRSPARATPVLRILGIEATGVVEEAPLNEFAKGQTVLTAMGDTGRAYDEG